MNETKLLDGFREQLREQYEGTKFFNPFYMDVQLQSMMYHATSSWYNGWRMFE